MMIAFSLRRGSMEGMGYVRMGLGMEQGKIPEVLMDGVTEAL
jgi:hypothetical protein